MPTQAHTVGNWLSDCSATNGYCRVYRVFTGKKIVERVIASIRGAWMTEDEREANCRLIAAAPDLLRALKDLLAASEWRDQSLTRGERTEQKAARAAILKATEPQS